QGIAQQEAGRSEDCPSQGAAAYECSESDGCASEKCGGSGRGGGYSKARRIASEDRQGKRSGADEARESGIKRLPQAPPLPKPSRYFENGSPGRCFGHSQCLRTS